MTISSSSLELSIIAVAQTLDSNAVILLFTARLVDFTGPQLRRPRETLLFNEPKVRLRGKIVCYVGTSDQWLRRAMVTR
jgi:hypothetical protein